MEFDLFETPSTSEFERKALIEKKNPLFKDEDFDIFNDSPDKKQKHRQKKLKKPKQTKVKNTNTVEEELSEYSSEEDLFGNDELSNENQLSSPEKENFLGEYQQKKQKKKETI